MALIAVTTSLGLMKYVAQYFDQLTVLIFGQYGMVEDVLKKLGGLSNYTPATPCT